MLTVGDSGGQRTLDEKKSKEFAVDAYENKVLYFSKYLILDFVTLFGIF